MTCKNKIKKIILKIMKKMVIITKFSNKVIAQDSI